MPQLRDPNFRRSIVLVVHHDDEGTFGVVLNRVTEISAAGLCASLDVEWQGEVGTAIGWGGPVQPSTGWLVFDAASDKADEDVQQVADGICFAGSLDVLRRIATLEMELAEGAWLVAPLSREVVFDVDASVMWDHVLRTLGVDPSTLIASRGVH